MSWRDHARDLQVLVECAVVVVVTWLALGWPIDRALSQADGTVQWIPYLQKSLEAGFDWRAHLYSFDVIGGSALHDSAGTLPITQLASALGLGATATANLITIALQTCFAYFGLLTSESLATTWLGRPRSFTRSQRITITWVCGFSPVLAWQYSMGHENLLCGLLPFVAAAALLLRANTHRAAPVTAIVAALATFIGVSALGAQMIVYCIVFVGPLAAIALWQAPHDSRWTRRHWVALACTVAGVLLAAPRLAGMFAYATGDDFGRAGSGPLTYSFGASSWSDWAASIPWTSTLARDVTSQLPLHERNVVLGPLLVALPILWPRGVSRRLLVGVFIMLVMTVLLATDVAPVSTLLLQIPGIDAFRVPSRAAIAVLAFVPPLALAAAFVRLPENDTRLELVGLLAALVVIAGLHGRLSVVREALAWIALVGFIVVLRIRTAQRGLGGMLAVVAALGVCAFDERFPRDVPYEPIEQGPARLRSQLLASAPELAVPLNRIEIIGAPPPYRMSLAFAAGVSSIDGCWYPTHRFLHLLSILRGKPLPPTSGVFELGRSSMFPVLQQLYNVRYVLRFGTDPPALEELLPTPGPAWFPTRIESSDTASVAHALAHSDLSTVAFVLPGDPVPADAPASCDGARVLAVEATEQTATVSVTAPTSCVLVVSTNYVRALRASVADHDVPMFPINVALTGILVPAGVSKVSLAPVAHEPWWTRALALVGCVMLVGAITVGARSSRVRSARASDPGDKRRDEAEPPRSDAAR